jgi:cytochrome-b5 reductase
MYLGLVGYVTRDLYEKCGLPKSSDEGSIVFVCGPPGLMNAVSGNKAPDKSQGEVPAESLLGRLGFTKDNVFKF